MKNWTRVHIEDLEQQVRYIRTIRAALLNAHDPKPTVQVSNIKHKKERLVAEQVEYVQRQVAELKQILSGLVDKVKPSGAAYAMHALSCGFTARDEKDLQAFWHKMSLTDPSTLTRERINAEFDATMHIGQQGGLEHILRMHYEDGQHLDMYRLVFGDLEPHPYPVEEYDDEDDEDEDEDETPV